MNSVPSWIKPYHVLSTGERARADIARRLQLACGVKSHTSTVTPASSSSSDSTAVGSSTNVDTKSGVGTGGGAAGVVVLDNFGHSLDAVTRGSCAVCAARAARKAGVCLIVASSLPDVAQRLQPDVILELLSPASTCSSLENPRLVPAASDAHTVDHSPLPAHCDAPARIVLNANAGAPPDIRMHVLSVPSLQSLPRQMAANPPSHLDGLRSPCGGVLTARGRVKAYGPSDDEFRCDPADEPRPHGGVSGDCVHVAHTSCL